MIVAVAVFLARTCKILHGETGSHKWATSQSGRQLNQSAQLPMASLFAALALALTAFALALTAFALAALPDLEWLYGEQRIATLASTS